MTQRKRQQKGHFDVNMAQGSNSSVAGDILRNILTTGGFLIVVGGAFWALAYSPIDNDLKEIRRELREVRTIYLTKESSQEYRQRMTDTIARIDNDTKRLDSHISDVFKNQVSKFEVSELLRRVEALDKQLGGLYPLGKVIDDINKRMDRLQANGKTKD